jgi:hypothetical protein
MVAPYEWSGARQVLHHGPRLSNPPEAFAGLPLCCEILLLEVLTFAQHRSATLNTGIDRVV